MTFFKTYFITLLYALLSSAALANPDAVDFGSIKVEMGKREYTLELAETRRQRVRGLMFRQNLCDDCGMVFTYPVPQRGSIWMKNTQIPLDLAYVDEDGVITNIFSLKPHDLTPVRSTGIVAYAIEMNQGWFASKKIKVGDQIIIMQ